MTRILPPGFSWVYVTDLDGTLADCSRRRHLLEAAEAEARGETCVHTNNARWTAFMRDQINDPLISETYHAIMAMRSYWPLPLIICTARAERFRPTVDRWLSNWNIPYDQMLMRSDSDHRPDVMVKRDMLTAMRLSQLEPWIVWDDRQSVVDMWRDAGITCHQVAEGDF